MARNFSTISLFWGTGLTQCSKEAQPHQQDVHPTYSSHSGWSKPAGKAHPQLPSARAAPEPESRSWLLLGYVPQITSSLCTVQRPVTFGPTQGVRASMCSLILSTLMGCRTRLASNTCFEYPQTVPEERSLLPSVLLGANPGSIWEKNKDHGACSCAQVPPAQASDRHFC